MVLFADIVGFTSFSERLDPEEVHTLVGNVLQRLAAVITEHGGHVDKFIGDAIMALFGAPVAHEDDADRAMAAALAMQETLTGLGAAVERDYGFPLAMRIGLNAGLVVAGALGRPGEYTVIGDAVNVAARIQPLAEPGGVVVSDTVRAAAVAPFRFREVGEVPIRGRQTPVRIYTVERASVAVEAPPAESVPCVGRERELERLREWWEATAGGDGRTVVVRAEAGIGKTRLLHAFLARLAPESAFVAVGQCRDYGAPLYLPMRQLFEQLLDQARERGIAESVAPAADLADAVRVLTGGTVETGRADPEAAETAKLVAHRFFVGFLGALSRHRPLLLVVEDLHWADALTEELLVAVRADVGRHPILLITTQRPEAHWPDSEPHDRLELGPLADAAAAELVGALLPPRAGAAVTEALVDRSQGNPFYLEELCRALREDGVLARRPAGWEWTREVDWAAVPDSVRRVIQARLDRLDPASRLVVREAAVLGSPFRRDLLQTVLSVEVDLDEALAALETAQMVLRLDPEGRRLQFRQNLIEQVAYESVLARRRREMHGRIGRHLEALCAANPREGAESLAHHFGRSDDDEKAITYLRLAAEKAQSLYANERAVALYEQTLKRIADHPDPAKHLSARLAASGGLAEIEVLQGRSEAAIARLLALRDQVPAPDEENPERVAYAAALRRLGYAHTKRAAYDQAEAEYRAALALLDGSREPEASAEQARIWYPLAAASYRRGRHEEARSHALAGVRAAEAAGEPDLSAGPLLILGLLETDQGEWEAARRYLERCLTIRERSGDPRGTAAALNNLGNVAMEEGHWADAERCYRRALDLREKIGFREGIAAAQSNLGNVRLCRGRLEEARECFEAAAAIGDEIGDPYTRLSAEACLGRLEVEAGRPDAAATRLRPALAEAQSLELADVVLDMELTLAESYLGCGEVTEAEALADAAGRHAAELENPLAAAQHQRLAGRLAARRGRLPDASAAFRESRDAFAALNQPHELARTLIAWAAADAEDGAAMLAEAVQILRRLGAEGDLRRLERVLAVLRDCDRRKALSTKNTKGHE